MKRADGARIDQHVPKNGTDSEPDQGLTRAVLEVLALAESFKLRKVPFGTLCVEELG